MTADAMHATHFFVPHQNFNAAQRLRLNKEKKIERS
jgi:hypothetical protein